MPTYDYVCAACGHAFEHFQEMSAKRLRTCPKCKKPRLERQVGTGAGLIFKGSGFYITDYKKPGATPSSESAPKADAEPGSATKPGADAKAAKPSSDPAPAPTGQGKDVAPKGAASRGAASKGASSKGSGPKDA